MSVSLSRVRQETGHNTHAALQRLVRENEKLKNQLSEVIRNNQVQIAEQVINLTTTMGSTIRNGVMAVRGAAGNYPRQLFIEHLHPAQGDLVWISLRRNAANGGGFVWRKLFAVDQ